MRNIFNIPGLDAIVTQIRREFPGVSNEDIQTKVAAKFAKAYGVSINSSLGNLSVIDRKHIDGEDCVLLQLPFRSKLPADQCHFFRQLGSVKDGCELRLICDAFYKADGVGSAVYAMKLETLEEVLKECRRDARVKRDGGFDWEPFGDALIMFGYILGRERGLSIETHIAALTLAIKDLFNRYGDMGGRNSGILTRAIAVLENYNNPLKIDYLHRFFGIKTVGRTQVTPEYETMLNALKAKQAAYTAALMHKDVRAQASIEKEIMLLLFNEFNRVVPFETDHRTGKVVRSTPNLALSTYHRRLYFLLSHFYISYLEKAEEHRRAATLRSGLSGDADSVLSVSVGAAAPVTNASIGQGGAGASAIVEEEDNNPFADNPEFRG